MSARSSKTTSRGFTVAELLLAVSLGLVLAAMAVPQIVRLWKNENEAAAIGALKTIATAEAIFREGDKENDGNLDYGMLSELAAAHLVDGEVGAGSKKGYVFEATYSYLTSEFLWFAVGAPELPQRTGDRYFQTNQAGVIFYTTRATVTLDTNTCMLPNNGTPWHC